ncbi:elicitor-like transglutaminase [Phytophthora cinnamomi]|uniref:elicitor-like transglutaminase n=1 Tax=Phytophthora cinnamomi TaxID=4785 RepID=UPI00355AA255|nr:elicitor-like transglutaminase [Phytophthora cinnamomi]
MVMVARSIAALGAAVAAASTVMVQAAPLEYNPYTPVELNAPLTASHPAYGAKPKSDCVKPVVPVDPNAAHAQSMAVRGDAASRMLRDMEDASGTDVDDLASFFGEKLEVDFTTLQKHYAGEEQLTPATKGSNVFAPERDIPSEVVTRAPTAPISQRNQGYSVQHNQGNGDYRQTRVSGEDARSVDQPASVEHAMCA